MDITKAEAYLYERLEAMCDEKVMLITKLNKIQLEIEETDTKIEQMSEDVDTAFEIFSPRAKKNDFVKTEIEKLKNRKEELKELFSDFSEQCSELEEDIKELREVLGEDPEADEEIFTIQEEKSEATEKLDGIQILEQQENERSRIARDLHDSVVQVLTSLVHKSEMCMKIVDVDSIRTKLELEIMAKTLRDTISEIRNIIYDLRPMSYDDLGLNVTLERIVKEFNDNTDMSISLKIEGENATLSNIVQLTIFRIVQECTNNSIKHSNGKNLNIKLCYEEECVYLEIVDDGEGFDANKVNSSDNTRSGFGLSMMKERVALLSGNIEVKTEIGNGTIIKVYIPL